MITGRSASRSSSPARSIAVAPTRAAAARASAGALAVVLGRLHEHVVQREVDERRPAVRRERRPRRRRRRARDLLGAARPSPRACVSGRTNGTWSISCSEPCPQRSAGARPPSTTHRRVVGLRRGHRAHPVGHARPGRQRAHAGLARDLRPALGRERRGRLVAHVDDLDPLLATAVVDREQVPAGQREQLAHAVRLQAPRDQPPAVEARRPAPSRPPACSRSTSRATLSDRAVRCRCPGWESNPHALVRPSILSRLRLPFRHPGAACRARACQASLWELQSRAQQGRNSGVATRVFRAGGR